MYLILIYFPEFIMEVSTAEMNRTAHPSSSSSDHNYKVQRKILEKNRRNQMKILYSQLNSLLPNHTNPTELPPTLPDQIDDAINYIKSMETKLKSYREKKKALLGRKRSSFKAANDEASIARVSPQIQIREVGSVMEVVLTRGLEDQFIFYEIIHVLHEERAEIINATYAVVGTTVFHTLHAEIEDVVYEFGAAKITERLKRLVCGSSSDAG